MVGASSASAFGAVALAARSSTCTTPAGPNATTRPGGTTATAELHGVYAFIAVVEFWHGHAPGSFAFALRVRRLRLALGRRDCNGYHGRPPALREAAYNAATMIRETGAHPTVLREQVSSPGGTSVSALRALEDHKVRAAFITAMEAARDRSRDLAQGAD